MWLDEVYARTVLAFARFAARFSDVMDRYFWDGLVRVLAGIGQLFGILSRQFDERGINSGVDGATTGTRGIGRFIAAKVHLGTSRSTNIQLHAWMKAQPDAAPPQSLLGL